MPYSLQSLDARTIEVRYTGVVGYFERAEAVERAAGAMRAAEADRLLVDFTHATPVEEDKANRADFIARTITHLAIPTARVALVGVSSVFAFPAELACEIRHIPSRKFDTRAEALEWLALDVIEVTNLSKTP
ncbi:hypothetical protein [Noviluteimonas gilva]|uniref:STAS/SEC14 domain-containing protein n=1 Tax=Noviluteimonas gilva TaxID=2682097 RepID=A0A7C9HYQ5_9GAMM|nr:hypothetical protein [Lysobacter gilvus]MUV14314.1 hypothetical protein [Lysobacter gilvus]